MNRVLCIPRLVSGGLIVNYRCSSACGHCVYASSPHREKEYVDSAKALQLFEAIRAQGCHAVHIGGGEPFLDFDGLCGALDAARQARVGVEYVETNASWFVDAKASVEKLRVLRSRGLDTLLVSMSPFHNERIAFRKVRGLLEACRSASMGVFPWVAEFIPEITKLDEASPHGLDAYAQRFGAEYIAALVSRYGITLGGRAVETFWDRLPAHSAQHWANVTSEGCARLTEVYHFHVDLFGNYVPGLCAGLAVRVSDLGKNLERDDYPVLGRLHEGGVGALQRWARIEHGFEPLLSYPSSCALCQDIRLHLVLERDHASHELQPPGFYRELEQSWRQRRASRPH